MFCFLKIAPGSDHKISNTTSFSVCLYFPLSFQRYLDAFLANEMCSLFLETFKNYYKLKIGNS